MKNDQHRKLAAILFADIAGYTALMQKNEAKALASLNKFKLELESQVPSQNGEIIQFYGDGCLAIFNSSVDAVDCAKALQIAFQKDPKVPVRIGLHAGDIVLKEGNIFGDAVNIASRVESLGVPGSVLLSSNVRNQIKNKSDFILASLGRFEFKNVKDSMTVYALTNEGLIVPKKEEIVGKLQKKKTKNQSRLPFYVGLFVILLAGAGYFLWPEKNTISNQTEYDAIAIFPFDVKGSPEIQYLGAGMVDLISTKLDEIPDVNAIDPNRVFSKLEKGSDISRQPEKAADISLNLGANKFILGSIVEINDLLEITASKYNNNGQLLDKKTIKGNKKSDLANSIDDLIKKIIAEEMKESGEEFKSLGAITSGNIESLSAYLKGEQEYRAGNYLTSYHHFVNATQLDSTFALAWMRAIQAASWDVNYNTPEAFENLKKYKHKLPKKWQEFYVAFMLHIDGNQKTEVVLKKLILKYGESRAFINGLAEFYFHFNPVYGRSILEAKPYLERNLELEPKNIESFVHLSECALMEGDSAALHKMKTIVKPESETYPEIQIKILMLKDTVTDEEIAALVNHQHFRNEYLFRTFIPIKKQPVNFELTNRILEQYPDKIFSILSPLFENGNGGRESIAFQFWKELSTSKEDFYVPLNKYFLCIPASLMADKTFLPLSEHYEDLFEKVKDKESSWEIYAAIKYGIALDKEKEVKILKKKLEEKLKDPATKDDAKFYQFSIKAFEARMVNENDASLIWMDSAFQYPNGFWEIQTASIDKTIMKANIYAERGEYEKAIPYFENLPIGLGTEFLYGYAIYSLSDWYEQIDDWEKALAKCDYFLRTYKNCDPKYRHWIEETLKRKDRIISKMN